MPWPKLELALKYLTAPQAGKRLGLSRFQLNRRVELGIFPRPTYVDVVRRGDVTLHVRYFDENWVRIAQAILDNAMKVSSAGAKE
jgi:hypothetical protein